MTKEFCGTSALIAAAKQNAVPVLVDPKAKLRNTKIAILLNPTKRNLLTSLESREEIPEVAGVFVVSKTKTSSLRLVRRNEY